MWQVLEIQSKSNKMRSLQAGGVPGEHAPVPKEATGGDSGEPFLLRRADPVSTGVQEGGHGCNSQGSLSSFRAPSEIVLPCFEIRDSQSTRIGHQDASGSDTCCFGIRVCIAECMTCPGEAL